MTETGSSLPSKRGPFWPLQQVTSGRQLAFLILSCTILVIVFAGLAQFMSNYWGDINYERYSGLGLYIYVATVLTSIYVLPIAAVGVGIGYFAVRRGSVREARIGRAGAGFVLGFLAGSFIVYFVFVKGDVLYLPGFLGVLAGVAAAVMATTVIVRLRG